MISRQRLQGCTGYGQPPTLAARPSLFVTPRCRKPLSGVERQLQSEICQGSTAQKVAVHQAFSLCIPVVCRKDWCSVTRTKFYNMYSINQILLI